MTSLLRDGLSPGCVTGVGSLPFTDADEAVEFVAKYSPELPFWPQLPLRCRRGADRSRLGIADRVPRARRPAVLLGSADRRLPPRSRPRSRGATRR